MKLIHWTVLFFSLLLAQFVLAGEEKSDEVREKLSKLFPVESILYVPEVDLFQIELPDGTILFSSEEADHFVVGELYAVENNRPVNITQRDKDAARVKAVANLKKEDLIVFPAEGQTTGSMYVFTDIDCSYCRRLDSEMSIYNSNGIEVRYIAWPRCGTNCHSYEKFVSVWCADDQLTAMRKAKTGAEPEPKVCDNPVKDQYELGVELGLRGTPFIILDDGTTIPGYKPASEIVQLLNSN